LTEKAEKNSQSIALTVRHCGARGEKKSKFFLENICTIQKVAVPLQCKNKETSSPPRTLREAKEKKVW
jgi:hypothetical protein